TMPGPRGRLTVTRPARGVAEERWRGVRSAEAGPCPVDSLERRSAGRADEDVGAGGPLLNRSDQREPGHVWVGDTGEQCFRDRLGDGAVWPVPEAGHRRCRGWKPARTLRAQQDLTRLGQAALPVVPARRRRDRRER